MRILLATTFRDLGNKKNKILQKKFLQSLNNKYANIDLAIRQFGEKNIKKFIKSNYDGKLFFLNNYLQKFLLTSIEKIYFLY